MEPQTLRLSSEETCYVQKFHGIRDAQVVQDLFWIVYE